MKNSYLLCNKGLQSLTYLEKLTCKSIKQKLTALFSILYSKEHTVMLAYGC